MTLSCRTCPETWSWGAEFSPLLLRDSHACPRCGRVSRRPRFVFGAYMGLVLFAINSIQGWRLGLIALVLVSPSLVMLENWPGRGGPVAKP